MSLVSPSPPRFPGKSAEVARVHEEPRATPFDVGLAIGFPPGLQVTLTKPGGSTPSRKHRTRRKRRCRHPNRVIFGRSVAQTAGRSHQWLPAGLRWPQWYARRITASRVQDCAYHESRMVTVHSRDASSASVWGRWGRPCLPGVAGARDGSDRSDRSDLLVTSVALVAWSRDRRGLTPALAGR